MCNLRWEKKCPELHILTLSIHFQKIWKTDNIYLFYKVKVKSTTNWTDVGDLRNNVMSSFVSRWHIYNTSGIKGLWFHIFIPDICMIYKRILISATVLSSIIDRLNLRKNLDLRVWYYNLELNQKYVLAYLYTLLILTKSWVKNV